MHFTGFDRRIWRYLDLERTKPWRNNVSRGVCWGWKLWKCSYGLIFSICKGDVLRNLQLCPALTLPPNSVPFHNTKQAAIKALCPVVASWSVFWNSRRGMGLWGCGCAHLGVHSHRLFTNPREMLPRKGTATLSFHHSFLCLLPHLGNLKLTECENYLFLF